MSKIIKIKTKEKISLKSLKPGLHKFNIAIPGNPMGTPWQIPCIILKGNKSGPTLGVTAALHGDELNGINTIFKLFEKLDSEQDFSGILMAVPIVNVPGFMLEQREYSDGKDLNRRMPGKLDAQFPSDVYNHYLTSKIVKLFDYHLDLHTASVGRVNSLYIRVDLNDEKCKELAYLQNPHLIVSKYDEEGTLRAWANSIGIPSITIEIGNPNTFQPKLIDETLEGIFNTMKFLKMIPGDVKNYMSDTIICDSSAWENSSKGGLLEIKTQLTEVVEKGDIVAVIYNVFGDIIEEITAGHKGIVIGMRTKPNCNAGDRIVHLGTIC